MLALLHVHAAQQRPLLVLEDEVVAVARHFGCARPQAGVQRIGRTQGTDAFERIVERGRAVARRLPRRLDFEPVVGRLDEKLAEKFYVELARAGVLDD